MDDNIMGFPGYHVTKEGKLYRYGKLHNGSISKNLNAKLKPEDRVKIKELHVKGISAREIRNKYFPNVCEETIRRTINQCLI